MTTINIGTNHKNIKGVKIDKPFREIKLADVREIAKEHLPDVLNVVIYGWADVTPELPKAQAQAHVSFDDKFSR